MINRDDNPKILPQPQKTYRSPKKHTYTHLQKFTRRVYMMTVSKNNSPKKCPIPPIINDQQAILNIILIDFISYNYLGQRY